MKWFSDMDDNKKVDAVGVVCVGLCVALLIAVIAAYQTLRALYPNGLQ